MDTQFLERCVAGSVRLLDGRNVIARNAESIRARRELFQPGAYPFAFAGGGVSARTTPDRSGGRSSMTVFHTVSTSTLS